VVGRIVSVSPSPSSIKQSQSPRPVPDMAVYAVKRQSRVVAYAMGTANEPNVTSPHLRHGCSGRPTASSPGGSSSGGKGSAWVSASFVVAQRWTAWGFVPQRALPEPRMSPPAIARIIRT
jgi:hypothetical protein